MLEHFTRDIDGGFLRVDGDGRTVTGTIVPYEQPAHIIDQQGEYDEVFTRASLADVFAVLGREPHRAKAITLNLEHREDLEHRLGFAVELHDGDDGAAATFELYPHRAELARSMLTTSHTGLSINFGARTTRTRPDGCRERLGVRLFHVAATPVPAYAGALITAVRADGAAGFDYGTPRLDAQLVAWGDLLALPSAADAPGTP